MAKPPVGRGLQIHRSLLPRNLSLGFCRRCKDRKEAMFIAQTRIQWVKQGTGKVAPCYPCLSRHLTQS